MSYTIEQQILLRMVRWYILPGLVLHTITMTSGQRMNLKNFGIPVDLKFCCHIIRHCIMRNLALAGHYHGGIVRIPGLGGLYHPEEGFFPKYSGGEYSLTYGKLIVSRGLGDQNFSLRINNKPELVIIDINE